MRAQHTKDVRAFGKNRALAQVAKEQDYVEHYNDVRLNTAIGYITPRDMLAGRQEEIHSERVRRLAAARQQRQVRRQQARMDYGGAGVMY